ncbi:MAG: LD-carboxypeptidase [Patescibacteria group bacterium]
MKIGIISPSAPSTHTEERAKQYKNGLKTLRSMGFECVVAPHAEENFGYISSSRENRLSDLHQMFSDESVDVVLCANGGRNASHLLDGLDFRLIEASKKMLVGFSDISTLLNPIYAETGGRQIHGPMVTWGFDVNDSKTNESFKFALEGKKQAFPLNEDTRFLKGNEIQGTLVGGNLASLLNLIGTPYVPDWKDKVLFWEETNEALNSVDRMITHMKNAGILAQLGGMIIGHLDEVKDSFSDVKKDVLKTIVELCAEYDFPILKTNIFGHHITPNYSIPIGGIIRINKFTSELEIE